MRLGTTSCSLQDFTTVDIIGLLPTRPIIPRNYVVRYQNINEACPNVTRKVIQNMIQDRIKESRLTQLMQDVRNNWDRMYSFDMFPPAKAFNSDKINATKNRHI
jgi:hypothetical protein